MWSPDDKRFVFVTGKGGVGKTTVTAAMARALAARGKRVLIAMCNTKERISAMFGSPPVGPDIIASPSASGPSTSSPITPSKSTAAWSSRCPGSTGWCSTTNMSARFSLRSPGFPSGPCWARPGSTRTETDERGANRFDVVLLDAPATGHGLDMLRVPKVILEVVPPGILRRDAELAWKMFQDPAQTSVVVVTLAEELPISETIGLTGTIERELALPLGTVVVNGVLLRSSPTPSDSELSKVEPRAPSPGEVEPPSAARGRGRGRRRAPCLRRSDFRRKACAPRRSARWNRIVLPFLFEDAASPAAIGLAWHTSEPRLVRLAMNVRLVHEFRFEAAHRLPRSRRAQVRAAARAQLQGRARHRGAGQSEDRLVHRLRRPVRALGAAARRARSPLPERGPRPREPHQRGAHALDLARAEPRLPALTRVTLFETCESRCEYEGH